ncbi:MAG: gamma-glutamyl-gamma-aminobutyrate hydrolase family protein [Desulfopila sp.]
MKALIGVVAHTELNPLKMPTSSVPLAYTRSIEKAGGIPLIIPYSEHPAELAPLVERMAGLLIPGGIDIAPHYYREEPIAEIGTIDSALDRFQLEILELALEKKKPLLGICRGAQLVNVALGGTLYQDIDRQCPPPCLPHMAQDKDLDHRVAFEPGSRLYQLFGPHLTVNSHHHQAIRVLAHDFLVTARTADQVIEAVQHRYLPIDLVQWHPERMLLHQDTILPLFQHFIQTAGATCVNW